MKLRKRLATRSAQLGYGAALAATLALTTPLATAGNTGVAFVHGSGQKASAGRALHCTSPLPLSGR